MFKRLRNRMLIANMAIISALILASFTLIYVVMAQNTYREINARLEREANFGQNPRGMRPDGPRDMQDGAEAWKEQNSADMIPPEPPKDADGNEMQPEDMPKMPNDMQQYNIFEPVVTAGTDTDGTVTRMRIDASLSDYIDESALSETAEGIILSGKERGRVQINDARWDYYVVKTDDGASIALGRFDSEHRIMLTLIIVLSLAALIVLLAMFFISLYTANRNIRPIEEAYNKQKQFIADASHELKTPLATINTNIDVLMSHGGATIDEEKKWLTYIKDEAKRMSKLTNDLLYLARAEHDEGNIEYSSVSWTEVVNNAIMLMEVRAFEMGIDLNSEIAENVAVLASKEQLKQLVIILLDNAIKYTPKAGEIKVKLIQKSTDAVLSVKNTGGGISEEDLEHIFDRFYRSDKARTNSGSYGLGLAIAKAITKSFKGTIKAESKMGEYAEFIVKLPLDK